MGVTSAHQRRRRGGGSSVSPARKAAFAILRRVEEGAFASVLLASSVEELRAEDRNLCYEIVMGVLRWQQWLDALIEYYARRSPQSLDEPVRLALRIGLYQLRFLSRIPASAAVNESVNIVRQARVRSADSFVNAVLRRATREPDYDPSKNISDPVERIAVETSHPAWLIRRWADSFGIEETEAFARANNDTPPVALRIVTQRAQGRDVLEELRKAAARLEPSKIAPGAWRVQDEGSSLRRLAGEGLIYTQDEASQLVAHVLGARPGERVLDVCAAPGSKTTHTAALTGDTALVVAGDLHQHRLRVVRELCERHGLGHVRAVVLDATKDLPFVDGSFDRVLVDAPCTGTGTLRRNPEIRWRISASDVADLSERQRRILFNASRIVRPGGRLVYSTCSVEVEENEDVRAAFLGKDATFTPASPPVPAPLQTISGAARTWPHRDGADGFFIAAFERRS